MFVSLHDSDHEGIVRIFVALSCQLGGFFNYLIILYYVEQFFPYQECNNLQKVVMNIFISMSYLQINRHQQADTGV